MGVVFQTLGGAFGLAAAQSGFINRLISTLKQHAVHVDPAEVIATGSTQIRLVFSGKQLLAVIDAYMAGLRATFAVMAGCTGVAFLLSLTLSWKSLQSKPDKSELQDDAKV